jgi:hypothetical protein
MTDLDDMDLRQLAPTVDATKAHALFDERRRRRRTRRRGLAVGGIATCIAVLGLGTWAVVRDDRVVSVDTGLTDQSAGAELEPAFEVLAMQTAHESEGTIRAAVDETTLRSLWQQSGLEGTPPAVDFARSVVISMTIPDDACPPTLAGFDRVNDALTPAFIEPSGGCVVPSIPKTFIVALNRSDLPPSFSVRLPAAGPTTLDQYMQVVLEPFSSTQGTRPLEPCLRQNAASICIERAPNEFRISARVSGLQPGTSVWFRMRNGEWIERNVDETEPGGNTGYLGAIRPNIVEQIHVTGTTKAGRPITGTVGIAG